MHVLLNKLRGMQVCIQNHAYNYYSRMDVHILPAVFCKITDLWQCEGSHMLLQECDVNKVWLGNGDKTAVAGEHNHS